MLKNKVLISSAVSLILILFIFLPGTAAESNIYAANRSAGKYLSITFDDGPHPVYTAQILDILRENGAKATFFVIGENAEKYPELVLREYQEGHEIGNHTYSHPDMNRINVIKAVEEISKTQQIIFNITGEEPRSFRAPGGIFSKELVSAAEGFNCKPILWSWRQDTRDWSLPKVTTIVDSVINNLQDGDIILFHDYNTKGSPTPEALKILLPKLTDMGYTFVTVSELLEIKSVNS